MYYAFVAEGISGSLNYVRDDKYPIINSAFPGFKRNILQMNPYMAVLFKLISALRGCIWG